MSVRAWVRAMCRVMLRAYMGPTGKVPGVQGSGDQAALPFLDVSYGLGDRRTLPQGSAGALGGQAQDGGVCR